MARLIVPIAALALGTASALALVSCGNDSAELLPGETADQIVENLDTVEALAAEGDCEGARRAAAEVSGQVDGLSGVDRELVQALRRGTDRLETVVADCESATTVTETDSTATTDSSERTGSERTKRTTTDRSETTATGTTTQPTTTQTTTPTTTATQTVPQTPTTTSPSGGVTPGSGGGGQ